MEELIKQLQKIKSGVDFAHETHLVDNKLLKSFDIIQIIAMLAEEYDISVPAAQIMPGNFNSAQAIYDLIQRLGDD